MVKVRDAHPRLSDGTIDIQSWLKRIAHGRSVQELHLIQKACELATHSGNQTLTRWGAHCDEQGLMTAEVLHGLGLDTPTLATAIVYGAVRYGSLTHEEIQKELDPSIMRLLSELEKMDTVHARTTRPVDPREQTVQNLRKMMLAVVEDLRVVLIKLAEHLCEMRAVVKQPDPVRRKLALEAKEIFAPLANRLGIGQIKWELEDLMFRFSEPTVYKNIAKLLDEKREDREKYIQEVVSELSEALNRQGIHAELSGRVKHIYSIWRKMQRKMVSYSEIYDVRAIRIMVPHISDCYAALGVVHTLWQHIPKEFDDYIANPKNNGYRSLHSALVGPQGRVIEVQIRTQAMHDQAELGIAAHWRYKEGGRGEASYDEKLVQLRQTLNFQEDAILEGTSAEALRAEFFGDRVYVFTPDGDVFDLPQGATPLDFAYTVHTEIGHRCRGAKVNGQMVTLSHSLTSGAQVEILTAKEGGPSRDWLNPDLKYLVTARARSKVHQWFKRQDRESNVRDGRDILNRELKRLGFQNINLVELASKVGNCHSDEDLLAGLGGGDIRLPQVLNAIQRLKVLRPVQAPEHLPRLHKTERIEEAEITVLGVGNLMCHMARCCRPVPGEPIVGYITVGEGVSIHRQDCINILQAKEKKRNRLIEVAWGQETKNVYIVNIIIKAYKRRNLLKDITTVFSTERVDVQDINTQPSKQPHIVDYKLTLEVTGIEMLGRVLTRVQQVPNVIDVYRVHD